jgi:APA family basic amino acid/polyamine antiporter
MAELKRELGPFSCTLLVAGNMIGVGIFVTAGRIYHLLPDPSFILLAWIIGGALSLAGGLAYAELATRFPRAGGGYVYSREAFGPIFGFLAGFSASLVTIPGTAAFLAHGFMKYAGITDPWISRSVAVLLILSISYVNYRGVLKGAELQDGLMILKLFLIFALILAGFGIGSGSFSHFAERGVSVQPLWYALPLALIPVMYTYSGWDATVYVAGEVRDPDRTIPLSLFFGALLVTLVYLALAALYLYAIPVTSPIVSSPENKTRIVTAASSALFGGPVGQIIGGLVAASVLGCLSATVLTGPRVIYAMAKDGLLPSVLGGVHERFSTPAAAIWFHGLWACLLAVTGTFDQLLDYVTVPSVFFNAVNVVGLFVLRSRGQQDPGARPYRMFGYPWLPALFVLGMSGIVVNTAWRTPQDSLWGLVIVALGVPVYFLWTRVLKKTA